MRLVAPPPPDAESTQWATIDSPVGPLTLTQRADVLVGLTMEDQAHVRPMPPGAVRDDKALAATAAEVDAYFAGTVHHFEVAVGLEGTDFQCHVWEQLAAIPYGTTITYGELARRVGRPGAARAVGQANGHNPVALIVPCHRVVATGGLGGYGGGLGRKVALLDFEQSGSGPMARLADHEYRGRRE